MKKDEFFHDWLVAFSLPEDLREVRTHNFLFWCDVLTIHFGVAHLFGTVQAAQDIGKDVA